MEKSKDPCPPSVDEATSESSEARLPAGLYVVGTPIGHMGDITFRALETLRQAEVIFAEDTRQTARLLERYRLPLPRFRSCHRFNEAARAQEAVEWVRRGAVVALATNAGMPGVSDPGTRLVRAVRAAGFRVQVVPGPSAVTAALVFSGYGRGEGFWFEGFLPRRSSARRRRLQALAAIEAPVVICESPHRLLAFLEDAAAVLGDRPLFVARELTKRFEEGREGTAAALREHFTRQPPRGEITVVVAPPIDSRSKDGYDECFENEDGS